MWPNHYSFSKIVHRLYYLKYQIAVKNLRYFDIIKLNILDVIFENKNSIYDLSFLRPKKLLTDVIQP